MLTWKAFEITSSWRATWFLQLEQQYNLGPITSSIWDIKYYLKSILSNEKDFTMSMNIAFSVFNQLWFSITNWNWICSYLLLLTVADWVCFAFKFSFLGLSASWITQNVGLLSLSLSYKLSMLLLMSDLISTVI